MFIYLVNQIFLLEGFLQRLIRPPGNMLPSFTSFHLAHTNVQNDIIFHNEMLEIDVLIPDTMLPVILAPLTGFHATRRQNISRVSISSALNFATKIRVLRLSVPKSRFISNHPIQFSKRISNGDLIFFLFLQKNIMLAWARVACVSSRARGQTKSRVQILAWRPCSLRVDHKEFSPS